MTDKGVAKDGKASLQTVNVVQLDEAKDLAKRAYQFKRERGRLPSMTSADAWERRMAEGANAFVRYKDEGRYD